MLSLTCSRASQPRRPAAPPAPAGGPIVVKQQYTDLPADMEEEDIKTEVYARATTCVKELVQLVEFRKACYETGPIKPHSDLPVPPELKMRVLELPAAFRNITHEAILKERQNMTLQYYWILGANRSAKPNCLFLEGYSAFATLEKLVELKLCTPETTPFYYARYSVQSKHPHLVRNFFKERWHGVQTISDAPSDGAFLHAGTSKFITGAGYCKWHADSRGKAVTCEELVQELQELQASSADPTVDVAAPALAPDWQRTTLHFKSGYEASYSQFLLRDGQDVYGYESWSNYAAIAPKTLRESHTPVCHTQPLQTETCMHGSGCRGAYLPWSWARHLL